MFRVCLTNLSLLSLLVCIATATLWCFAERYWVELWLVTERSEPTQTVIYLRGVQSGYESFYVGWAEIFRRFDNSQPTRFFPEGNWRIKVGSGPRSNQEERGGNAYMKQEMVGGEGEPNHIMFGNDFVEAKYWAVISLAGALPLVHAAISFRRLLVRRARVAANHCVVCDYDLRESPDRCPECGALKSGPSRQPVSSDAS